MSLPDRIRLPYSFDPAALAGDLSQVVNDDWTRHFVRQNYNGNWSAIALRAPAGETHPIRMIFSDPSATTFVETPLLARAQSFQKVLARFSCPLLSVRLMRLGPGSQIKPHRDLDLDADIGIARLHVPILTGPEVEFRLNGTPVAMRPGECWYLRLSEEHSVVNNGTVDRVHIVIDAEVNDWLMDELRAAAAWTTGADPIYNAPMA